MSRVPGIDPIPPDAEAGESAAQAGTAADREELHHVGLLDIATIVLMLAGAFGWGCVALFGNDPVSALFGATSGFTRSLQLMVGLSSLHAVMRMTRLLRGQKAPRPLRADAA